MGSSFGKKIEGIPLALVQQGWRLYPGDDVFQGWLDASVANRWDSSCVGRLQIFRPVAIVHFPAATVGPTVYAHAGWGDGLSPTVEMLEVWPFWWMMDDGDSLLPKPVQVHRSDDGIWWGVLPGNPERRMLYRSGMRGPVLPPATVGG